MTLKRTKLKISILSICLALICGLTYCLTNYLQTNDVSTTQAVVRTIDASANEVDYQSIFNEFDTAKLDTVGTLTTFEGTKSISLEDFAELDNLSESDIETCEDMTVTYNFSYDAETNIVTVSATTKSGENTIEIEEIQGVAFINEQGNIDAVMNIDGEGLLLSEMQDMGIIQNCGWFKNLFKKVVKVVAVAAAVVAVAAVVVATVGATAPAVVAAGVGVIGGGSAAIASASLATAAVAAGVAMGTVLSTYLLDSAITLTNTYVLDFAASVKKTNRLDRYLLVVLSALDQPLITHYKPVSLEVAKNWFKLGGQVWTPYSNDAQILISDCGYVAGNSKGEIGVAERNIISLGNYGYYHYHALDQNSHIKIRLPGNGTSADSVKAHAMHCFFYY